MRASIFSAAALTRFSSSLLREQARSRRGLLLFSNSKKGTRFVWMGQKLQHEQHAPRLAVTSSAARIDGENGYKNLSLEDEYPAMKSKTSSLVVVSFYKFADLPDYAEMRTPLRELCDVHRVSGGIILAPEGINGSICGTRESVEKVFATLLTDVRLRDLRRNEGPATEEEEDLHHGHTSRSPLGAGDDAPFRWGHVRVKLKNEEIAFQRFSSFDILTNTCVNTTIHDVNVEFSAPMAVLSAHDIASQCAPHQLCNVVCSVVFLKRSFSLMGMTANIEGTIPKDIASEKSTSRRDLYIKVVPLGVPGVNPSEKVGTYVKPKDWNALISDPTTLVVDVRNDYEIRIGKFKGAEDPKTEAFREFPTWVENRLGLFTAESAKVIKNSGVCTSGDNGQSMSEIDGKENQFSPESQPPRIAMYCTGGIRCEKASSFLIDKGFDEVYHLEGGILKYLEEVPLAESLWEGECFVFDKRVSVEHGLKQGTHTLCYACKKPVNDDDKKSPLWEEGVSCPYCYSLKSPEERKRARARQIQYKTTGIIGGPGNGRRIVQDPTLKKP